MNKASLIGIICRKFTILVFARRPFLRRPQPGRNL